MIHKRALLTGASGSIGLAIADKLAEAGFDLLLFGRSEERLRSTTEQLIKNYPDVQIDLFTCDVREAAQVRAALTDVKDRYSTIGVLVNCAGIPGGGFTAEITDQLWNDVLRTNLDGTFFMTRDALHLGLIAEGGRIVNIASTGGKQGVIHAVPYSASKHAVVGLTKALGLELARNGSGITVNAVCPGFVESEMAERVRHHYASIWQTDVAEAKRRIEERVPIGRYIEPDEVAAMVSYLVSPLAAGVTAQALNVCGGLGNY
jgi:ketoreductase